jgi:hypothetical protein
VLPRCVFYTAISLSGLVGGVVSAAEDINIGIGEL